MYDPSLYSEANELQVRDILTCMEIVKTVLPKKRCELVLDVGCGPGDTTTSLLPRYLDLDYKIIGCDISEAMVKHAQATYGNDRFSFKLLDISSKDIWTDWKKESFDKIISYFCLHWVSDQRQAAENMYNLLKENGYIVTTFITKHAFIDFFDTLITNPKWQPYVKRWPGWRAIIDSNASKEYLQILSELGFEVMMTNLAKKEFVHKSKERFLDFLQSINPYVSNIPVEQRKEFINECKDSLQQLGAIQINDKGHITHQYTLLTTVARKRKSTYN